MEEVRQAVCGQLKGLTIFLYLCAPCTQRRWYAYNNVKTTDEQQNIIIYRTADGRASVALFAKDGKIWLNQQQMPNISMHIANILKEKELTEVSVVKNFLTTAADGKDEG